jgi:hypothetical protein
MLGRAPAVEQEGEPQRPARACCTMGTCVASADSGQRERCRAAVLTGRAGGAQFPSRQLSEAEGAELRRLLQGKM